MRQSTAFRSMLSGPRRSGFTTRMSPTFTTTTILICLAVPRFPPVLRSLPALVPAARSPLVFLARSPPAPVAHCHPAPAPVVHCHPAPVPVVHCHPAPVPVVPSHPAPRSPHQLRLVLQSAPVSHPVLHFHHRLAFHPPHH